MPTFTVVSLGCPKNRVDSEVVAGLLLKDGYVWVDDPERAEILVVNTCSFIESARQESVDTLLELAELKKTAPRTLVAMGCLSQMVGDQVRELLPEVDLVIGTGSVAALPELLKDRLQSQASGSHGSFVESRLALGSSESATASFLPDSPVPRVLSQSSVSAYLKIADGCDRTCSFCTIPFIKGPFRSRPADLLVEEARQLVASGVRELVLVAQDLTRYGTPERQGLIKLLDRLESISGLEWIRLMYLYPEGLSRDLLKRLSLGGKVLPYLDIPIQHTEDDILKAMRRATSRKSLEKLIDDARTLIPNVSLRTTLIVGFPGETRRHFELMKGFLERASFDHLGVFAYSREEDTPSAQLPGQVSSRSAGARRRSLMEAQKRVSAEKNRGRVGMETEVLVSGFSLQHEWVPVGRTWWQGPEVDGVTYLDGLESPEPGLVRCRITQATEYDLVAVPLESQE